MSELDFSARITLLSHQVSILKTDSKPKRVLREIVRAYELRTGFFGIGDFFVKEGLLEYAEEC